MATRALTAGDFADTVAANDIVLIDFWADWCGPCHRFAPIYEAASEAHPDVVFGKVDTEEEIALAQGFGIQSIPTIMAFREKILVFQQAGALPAVALEELLEKVRGLDMDDIRRKIAEHEAGHHSAGGEQQGERQGARPGGTG